MTSMGSPIPGKSSSYLFQEKYRLNFPSVSKTQTSELGRNKKGSFLKLYKMNRGICKSTWLAVLPSLSNNGSAALLNFNFKPFRSFSTSGSSRVSSMATPDSASSSSSSDSPSASSAIDFLTLCHRLKTTKRTGWVKRDVDNPESIADHMYRMGLMALVAADIPGVNRDKCVKMAIVHDIAEAIVGDITPSDGIPKFEKSRMEREAMDHICNLLGGGPRAKEIADLWMEYEENTSLEAKVVKDFDKVEMILQALEYENDQGKDLEEFFQSTAGKFQTDVGKAWALEIASRRKSS